MVPRPFPPAFAAVLLWLVAVAPPVSALPPSAAPAVAATPSPSIVYRSDETDAIAQGLADQPQFSGCGYLYNGANNELGSGTAIAPGWVLTAKHVVTGYTTATFHAANGQVISGTVYTDTATDMALINLATPLQTTYGGSYTPIAVITPNVPGAAKVQPVGPLVWNVGYGDWGNYGGTVNAVDLKRRGGTNVVNSYGSSFLYFTNENTSGTEFECSTGPGDSGGPMYLQTGYQWRVAAEVNGTGSNGFQDTDVSYNSFLSTTTGINFAPQAAPACLTWNTNYLNASTAASKSVTNFADGGGSWDTTRLDFVGTTTGGDTYTYAWQNSTLLPVTFGKGSGTAGTVVLTTPVNISDLVFAAPGSGAYVIAGASANPLTLSPTGSTVTVNAGVTPAISATLAGTGALTKLGTGTLTLGGTNTYTGGTTVNAGTLALGSTVALGTSGDIAVAAGAVLNTTVPGANGFSVPAGRTLTNNGTVSGALIVDGILASAGGTFSNPLTINSDGLFNGTGGTVTVMGNITNNGTIRITGGAVLSAGGATSFVNNGLLDLISGSAQLPAGFTNGSGGVVLTSALVKVKSVTRNSTGFTLTIDSYSGHNYQLQSGTSPAAGSFANLGNAQTGSTGTTLTFTDASPAAGQGFYRVVLSP